MSADIIPLRDYARPQREAPAKPAEVVRLPKKPETYPMAVLGTGWPPEEMQPPADV